MPNNCRGELDSLLQGITHTINIQPCNVPSPYFASSPNTLSCTFCASTNLRRAWGMHASRSTPAITSMRGSSADNGWRLPQSGVGLTTSSSAAPTSGIGSLSGSLKSASCGVSIQLDQGREAADGLSQSHRLGVGLHFFDFGVETHHGGAGSRKRSRALHRGSNSGLECGDHGRRRLRVSPASYKPRKGQRSFENTKTVKAQPIWQGADGWSNRVSGSDQSVLLH